MLRQDVINAHAQWNVLDTTTTYRVYIYQEADDPFWIKGMGASEVSRTPCIF